MQLFGRAADAGLDVRGAVTARCWRQHFEGLDRTQRDRKGRKYQ